MVELEGSAGMHGFGGGVHRPDAKFLFMVCFCLLHHHILASAEPPSTEMDNFKSLLLNTNTYIDRSLLIADLMFSRRGYCGVVMRPKGWGKTLNMNMLRRFFELEITPNGTIVPDDLKQNTVLFTGGNLTLEDNTTKILKPLKIVSDKTIMKRQGNHPVVFLNLTGIDGFTYEDFQDAIKARVLEAYKRHAYLSGSTNLTAFETTFWKKYSDGRLYSSDIIVSVNFLSRLLFKYFARKVMIFVDDYDAPVISAYQRFHRDQPHQYVKVVNFVRSLFVQSFHLNEYLEKGLINGMIKLPLLKIVYYYSLLDRKYSKYYGFQQTDLDVLLANVSFTPDFEKIKQWYGYKYNDSVQFYHPGSIMRYIASKGTFDYYWLDLKNNGIDGVLLSDDLQNQLRKLSKGQSILYFANFTDKENFAIVQSLNMHVLLLFSGFLTPVHGKWSNNDQHELVAANLQVKNLLQLKVLEWVAVKMNVTTNELSGTFEGKVEQLRNILNQHIGSIGANVSLFQNSSDIEFIRDEFKISIKKVSISNGTSA